MTIKEIQELIKLIEKSDLAEFKLKNKDVELVIRSQQCFQDHGNSVVYQSSAPMQMHMAPHQQAAPAVQAPPATDVAPSDTPTTNLIEVKSPMVGTFYRSSGPGKPSFVNVGDSIQKGSVVCIIEAMKLFNEIESEFSGKIVKVMVEDASPVEYDQVLFLIEP